MIIACATDDNFVQHCTIMLVSLLSNNDNVDIYVLTEGLTEQNTKILQDEVTAKGGVLHICKVDSKIIEQVPISTHKALAHISKATYYRLFMQDLLPESVEKVLYLDCDIVVNQSIRELWDVDLTGMAIAAVREIGSGYHAERLGIPLKTGYFNAGVNLLNLAYCREHNMTDKFMKYIKENYSKLQYNDQDVLNGVLHDKCVHLMPQWNMFPLMFDSRLNKRGDSRGGVVINEYLEEKANAINDRKNPHIVHYIAKPKPWDKGCVSKCYYLYYMYAKKTLNFKDIQPQSCLIHEYNMFKYDLKVFVSNIKQSIHKTDKSLL